MMNPKKNKTTVDYTHGLPTPAANVVRISQEFANLRLDQVLATLHPEHSRSRLQSWVKEGHVTLNGGITQSKTRLKGGEVLCIQIPDPTLKAANKAEAIPLTILFEDEACLVIDKPAGLITHPGAGHPTGTLLNALLHHAPTLADVPRAGLVHRLDKDTSGLLLVAKTLTAQTDLVRQLQKRTVSRIYLAVVCGNLKRGGLIDAPVGRNPRSRTRMAVTITGKPARTHYKILKSFPSATLLQCALDTGRTHQIRVHLSNIGYPLLGDSVYGRAKNPWGFARQALHAWKLTFLHPVLQSPLTFICPPPADIETLLSSLSSHFDLAQKNNKTKIREH